MHAKHAHETESWSLNFDKEAGRSAKRLFPLYYFSPGGRGTGGPEGQPVSRCRAQVMASLGSQPFRNDRHGLNRRIDGSGLHSLRRRRGRNGRMRAQAQGRKAKHPDGCYDHGPIEEPRAAGLCFCVRKHVPHSYFAFAALAAVNQVHSAFRCLVGHACQIECFDCGTIVLMLHCSECWPCT